MPNHVHLIAVPQDEKGLARAIGEAHRRYTRRINFRENWRGHLWQERFASCPMDEKHLLLAARYVEMNPGEMRDASQFAKNHDSRTKRKALGGQPDVLVKGSVGLSGRKTCQKDWGKIARLSCRSEIR